MVVCGNIFIVEAFSFAGTFLLYKDTVEIGRIEPYNTNIGSPCHKVGDRRRVSVLDS